MECFICHRGFYVLSDLLQHFRWQHGLCSNGSEVRCGQLKCPRVFLSFCKLKAHLLREHRDLLLEPSSAHVLSSKTSNDSFDPVGSWESGCLDIHDNNIEMAEDSNSTNLLSSFMKFTSIISSRANITQSNAQLVVSNVLGLIEDIKTETVSILNNTLKPKLNADDFNAVISQITDVGNCFTSVSTSYTRQVWLEKNGHLIKPNEWLLGYGEGRRRFKRQSVSKLVNDSFQTVSLKQLLTVLYSLDNFNDLLDQQKSSTKNRLKTDLIRNFMHTNTYTSHPFFQKHPDAEILHLFIDAYETTNPLGSHTSTHKLEGLYCIIGNLPSEYASKTNTIFLLGLWYAQDAKNPKYGYDVLLKPLMSELKQLESDEGMFIKLQNNKTMNVHGLLNFFSADNLGANSLFGFQESFNANRFCRYCLAEKVDVQEKFYENQFIRRNRESYDLHVNAVLANNSQPNVNDAGIKKACCLNNLKWFHCTEQNIVDCMHDLLEGIVPLEISLVLQKLIENDILTLSDVNECISNYNFSNSDKNSKPPKLTLPNLRLTSTEAWCLLRNLPLVIGSLVPRENDFWKLLILLLDITSIIFAPAITQSTADYLG